MTKEEVSNFVEELKIEIFRLAKTAEISEKNQKIILSNIIKHNKLLLQSEALIAEEKMLKKFNETYDTVNNYVFNDQEITKNETAVASEEQPVMSDINNFDF